MGVWEGFHDTHTRRNQQIGCLYRHMCSHTPARTHSHTHFDVGTGTMWLPSLQAVVVGGLSFFRTFVAGGRELENSCSWGAVSVWEGALFCFSEVVCCIH